MTESIPLCRLGKLPHQWRKDGSFSVTGTSSHPARSYTIKRCKLCGKLTSEPDDAHRSEELPTVPE